MIKRVFRVFTMQKYNIAKGVRWASVGCLFTNHKSQNSQSAPPWGGYKVLRL